MTDNLTQALYCTADSSEALCLYTAGIPFGSPPVANIYTVEWLEKHGFSSVKDAIRASRHGNRAWFFAESEERQKLTTAYAVRKKALKEPQPNAAVESLPKLLPDEYAAMCAFLTVNRQFIENMWKNVAAQKDMPDGRGGRIVIGENISDENRRKLGV